MSPAACPATVPPPGQGLFESPYASDQENSNSRGHDDAAPDLVDLPDSSQESLLIQKIHPQAPGPASVNAPAVSGPTAETVAPTLKMTPMDLPPLSQQDVLADNKFDHHVYPPPDTNLCNN
ncbi:hypothetical protein DL769_008366 [Monosporascus sp. CRB-8-3]|nr:hypothetical protein DL769_008366 [Monosporascus sp. CRB-8-3]